MNGSVISLVVRLALVLALLGAVVAVVALGQGGPSDGAPGGAAAVRPPVLLPPVREPEPPPPETRMEIGRVLRVPLNASALPVLRLARVEIDGLCAQLFAPGEWTVEGPARGEDGGEASAECTAERRFAASGRARATRGFAILRTREGALREMRIKLNLYSEATRAQAAAEADRIVGDLLRSVRWSDLAALAEPSVAELATTDETRTGARLRVFREVGGDVPRYNILVTVAPTLFEEASNRLLPVSPAQQDAFDRIANPG